MTAPTTDNLQSQHGETTLLRLLDAQIRLLEAFVRLSSADGPLGVDPPDAATLESFLAGREELLVRMTEIDRSITAARLELQPDTARVHQKTLEIARLTGVVCACDESLAGSIRAAQAKVQREIELLQSGAAAAGAYSRPVGRVSARLQDRQG